MNVAMSPELCLHSTIGGGLPFCSSLDVPDALCAARVSIAALLATTGHF
jgi:hypothetical protein